MTEIYRFAERTVVIDSIYSDIHILCSDYRTTGKADFSVRISQEDIDFEREQSTKENRATGNSVSCFESGYLETLAVYRKIAEKMPDYDTVLMHGSAISVDGEGYLFTAKSGTGKSTHTRLWREMLGGRAVMVNDDKPLIRLTDSGAVVYGTPWDGKHRLSNNIHVALKAICLLERAEENNIYTTGARDVHSFLLEQVYRPKNPEALIKTLRVLDKLTESVNLYRLGCNMNSEAAQVAYDKMRG